MKKLFLILFLLSACGTTNPSITQVKTIDITSQDQIETKFQEVLDFCQPRLQGYESKAVHQAKLAFYLKMSGLFAGSVIAPAIAAVGESTWIVASLAGWAGSTAFAGEALETSGLSGSAIAQTRNDIINNVRKHMKTALNGSNSFETRRDAIMAIQAECVLYEISVPTIDWKNQ